MLVSWPVNYILWLVKVCPPLASVAEASFWIFRERFCLFYSWCFCIECKKNRQKNMSFPFCQLTFSIDSAESLCIPDVHCSVCVLSNLIRWNLLHRWAVREGISVQWSWFWKEIFCTQKSDVFFERSDK